MDKGEQTRGKLLDCIQHFIPSNAVEGIFENEASAPLGVPYPNSRGAKKVMHHFITCCLGNHMTESASHCYGSDAAIFSS